MTELQTTLKTSNYSSYQRELTVRQQVVEPKLISKEIKDKGGPAVGAMISLIIRHELELLNYTKSLSPHQCLDAAMAVIDKYRNDTVDDVILAFKYFKQNRLPSMPPSKVFKIGVPEVIMIIDAYMLEIKIPDRESYHKELSQVKNEPTKDEQGKKADPEYVRKLVAQFERDQIMRKQKRREEELANRVTSPVNVNSSKDYVDYLVNLIANMSPDEIEQTRMNLSSSERKFFQEALIKHKQKQQDDEQLL